MRDVEEGGAVNLGFCRHDRKIEMFRVAANGYFGNRLAKDYFFDELGKNKRETESLCCVHRGLWILSCPFLPG